MRLFVEQYFRVLTTWLEMNKLNATSVPVGLLPDM